MKNFSGLRLFIVTTTLLFSSSAYSQYSIISTIRVDGANAFALLGKDRKNFGFGVIDSKGTLVWQIDIQGAPMELSRFGDNALVIYGDRFRAFKPTREIYAALINVKMRKIVKQKLIFKNDSKSVIDPWFLNDPDGYFSRMLIRKNGLTTGFGSGYTNSTAKEKQTLELKSISIDDELSTHANYIKGNVLSSEFVNAVAGYHKDLYITSFADGTITMERFDDKDELKGKLTKAISLKRNSQFFDLVKYDTIEPNCVDLAITYFNDQKMKLMPLFRFDFNRKTVIETETIDLNKNYVSSLEEANGNNKLHHFHEINAIQPVQIIEDNNKTIVLKEIQFQQLNGKSEVYFRMGSIISIYSKDLKLLYEIPIDKISSNFISDFPGIYGHVKDGKLYLITNNKKGLGFKTILYVLNVNDGTITSKDIKSDHSGPKWLTMPNQTIWFGTNYLVPFTSEKKSVRLKLDSELLLQEYEN